MNRACPILPALAACLALAWSAWAQLVASAGDACPVHGAGCRGGSCQSPANVSRAAGAKASLERPLRPRRPLVLEDAYRPGTKVDLAGRRGEIVVVRGIVPECGWWNRPGAFSIKLWRKLVKEYGDRVSFVAVRTDFGHRTNKAYPRRLEEAAAFGRKMSLAGPYLVDNDKLDFLRFGTVRYKPRGDRTWGPNGWGYMYILDRKGRIVCQHGSDPKFHYYMTRLTLDRMLDAAFAKDLSAGLPARGRALPKVVGLAGAKTYSDDFESYRDSYDFKLQPRWGFRCKPADDPEPRGDIVPKAGRGGSQAVDLHSIHRTRAARPSIEHALPTPLKRGSIRFHVRRGVPGWNRKDPKPLAAISVYGAKRAKLAEITVKGVWTKEPFALAGAKGPTGPVLSETDWHKVEFAVGGKAITVKVDGKAIGQVAGGAVTAVGFSAGHHGFYLDDVAVSYAAAAGEAGK